jgi:hypothetical protein
MRYRIVGDAQFAVFLKKINAEQSPPKCPNCLECFSREPDRDYCRRHLVDGTAAKVPEKLAELFIRILTEVGTLALELLAGSNVTGSVAERLGRRQASREESARLCQNVYGALPRHQKTALLRG